MNFTKKRNNNILHFMVCIHFFQYGTDNTIIVSRFLIEAHPKTDRVFQLFLLDFQVTCPNQSRYRRQQSVSFTSQMRSNSQCLETLHTVATQGRKLKHKYQTKQCLSQLCLFELLICVSSLLPFTDIVCTCGQSISSLATE